MSQFEQIGWFSIMIKKRHLKSTYYFREEKNFPELKKKKEGVCL